MGEFLQKRRNKKKNVNIFDLIFPLIGIEWNSIIASICNKFEFFSFCLISNRYFIPSKMFFEGNKRFENHLVNDIEAAANWLTLTTKVRLKLLLSSKL